VVDNTFASPILQRPLVLGADVVLHSTTKYCGGHSDVQGGCLVVKSRELLEKLSRLRDILGAVASPFNSWLVLRGLRSLPCRMERHSANAAAVAAAPCCCFSMRSFTRLAEVSRIHFCAASFCPSLARKPSWK
jgi:cystathionine gamma-synthase